MNEDLRLRLNHLAEVIKDPTFQHPQARGNEIGIFIFEYPAEEELAVRKFINKTTEVFATENKEKVLLNINLFSLAVEYLKSRNLLEKSIQMQQQKGDNFLLKALKGPMDEAKLAQFLVDNYHIKDADIIFLTGTGTAWPILRAHTLLNNLHTKIGLKPLVVFYPGTYDGQELFLFGKIRSANYYRAFKFPTPKEGMRGEG